MRSDVMPNMKCALQVTVSRNDFKDLADYYILACEKVLCRCFYKRGMCPRQTIEM